ncbi:DUF2334 domain-containing protein [Salinarchaeum laminariae]|uniref:DUF2334 domain-containing protein n=1 Tax=Salinarchaeum laminariae TaxID=869888 RepID=UPI0020C0AF95|nr:DUF2334 domain-containing protein [Salinarchaeum laminariae]
MTLQFAIRDDDCNAFTEVAELERAYARLPADVPVSFAVVPYHASLECPAVPDDRWDEAERRPLEANEDLIEYLQDGLEDGSCAVALHGYSHERFDGRPEFVAGTDLPSRIERGREHLEKTLEHEVDVFVPPNNSLSRRGIQAVKDAGMRLCYYPTPVNRPKTPEVLHVFLRDLWFKYRNKTAGPVSFLRDADRFWRRGDHSVFMPVRPMLYELQGSTEITCVSLTRHNPVDPVKRHLDVAAAHDGKFCVAVHYHAFRDDAFSDRFYELIDYARSNYDVEFVGIEELFE